VVGEPSSVEVKVGSLYQQRFSVVAAFLDPAPEKIAYAHGPMVAGS
jgi:hypothetical protein